MKNRYIFTVIKKLYHLVTNLNKKIRTKYYYFWDIITISIWLLFFLIGYITVKKLLLFFIILFVILMYKKLFKLTLYFDYSQKLYTYIIRNYKNFYILLKIIVLSSFISFILLRIELKLYYLMNYLNSRIKLIHFNNFIWICIFSLLILILPSKLIISRFYKLLENFNKLTMYKILCKRAFGSILSVIIFSDLMKFLVEMTGSLIYLYLYLYLFISLICFYDYFFNIFHIWEKAKVELNIILLIKKRNKNSIRWNIITRLWNNKIIDHELFMQLYNYQ